MTRSSKAVKSASCLCDLSNMSCSVFLTSSFFCALCCLLRLVSACANVIPLFSFCGILLWFLTSVVLFACLRFVTVLLSQTLFFRSRVLGFKFLQFCGCTTASVVSGMCFSAVYTFRLCFFRLLHSLVWCFPAHLTHLGSLLHYRCVCPYAWHCLHYGISLDFLRGCISTLLPRILVISSILFVFSSALNVSINI